MLWRNALLIGTLLLNKVKSYSKQGLLILEGKMLQSQCCGRRHCHAIRTPGRQCPGSSHWLSPPHDPAERRLVLQPHSGESPDRRPLLSPHCVLSPPFLSCVQCLDPRDSAPCGAGWWLGAAGAPTSLGPPSWTPGVCTCSGMFAG